MDVVLQPVLNMARAKTILQSQFPYNISARCINREWFNLPMDQVWEIFEEELYLTHRYYNLQIHLFVLMSNHFHLIASTPDSNISQCMYGFMKNTSLRLTRAGNRINQTFAGRHFKTILQTHNYFLNAYKYNYQNPCVAKISKRVEDYKYSTLAGLLGRTKLLIPMVEDTTLFSSLDETLSWLNRPSEPEKREAVRWALKRQYFRPLRCKNTRRSLLSENDVL